MVASFSVLRRMWVEDRGKVKSWGVDPCALVSFVEGLGRPIGFSDSR